MICLIRNELITAAIDLQRALLTLRKDQYIHTLNMKLKELEKETSSKLHLYSYNADKLRQLQLEFQNHTFITEQLQRKAQVGLMNETLNR